jgi:putative ABC transport system substrate-binding protein
MATSADPIGSGLVESLARPGGNVTGLTNVSPDLAGKRLELLKDSVPRLSRVAIFGWRRLTIQGGDASFELELRELQDVAQGLRLQLQILELRTPDDFDNAFRTAKKWGAGALYTSSSSILATQRKNIIELAEKNRLPALYPYSGFAQSGGLMSYGPSIADQHRRAAVFVDKILKGAKPADIPVERPTKFELVINLKTAKQIGLIIPPNVLARADRVIK